MGKQPKPDPRRSGVEGARFASRDDLSLADRRRLMLLIEARLNAAHSGDCAQFRREIAMLTRRTEQLLNGERSASTARKNVFERIRDRASAINGEVAVGAMILAFILATTFGVFGPFMVAFAAAEMLR